MTIERGGRKFLNVVHNSSLLSLSDFLPSPSGPCLVLPGVSSSSFFSSSCSIVSTKDERGGYLSWAPSSKTSTYKS